MMLSRALSIAFSHANTRDGCCWLQIGDRTGSKYPCSLLLRPGGLTNIRTTTLVRFRLYTDQPR
jgi:hypothetical protein